MTKFYNYFFYYNCNNRFKNKKRDQKYTKVISKINIFYTVSLFISLWLFFMHNNFFEHNYITLLNFSVFGMILARYFMGAIGKCSLINIRENNDDNQVNLPTNTIGWEFSLTNNENNYYFYECCICLENKLFPFRVNLLPCGHNIFCKICVEQIDNLEKCPICRQKIDKVSVNIRKN